MGPKGESGGLGRNQAASGLPPQTLHPPNRSSTPPSQHGAALSAVLGGLLSCTCTLLTQEGVCAHPADEERAQKGKVSPKSKRANLPALTASVCTQHFPPQFPVGQAAPGLLSKCWLPGWMQRCCPSPSRAPSPHTSLSLTSSAPQAPLSLLTPTHPEASDLLGPYPGGTCLGDIFPRWLVPTSYTRLAPAHWHSEVCHTPLPGAPSTYQPRSTLVL